MLLFFTGAEYCLVHACVYVLQNRTLELETNRKEKNLLDIHILKYKQQDMTIQEKVCLSSK